MAITNEEKRLAQALYDKYSDVLTRSMMLLWQLGR